MIFQVIESRYTVDYDVLSAYLQALFQPEPFEITVCAPTLVDRGMADLRCAATG